MFLLLLLYYCTLISSRFNNSRIFAEALKAGTDLGVKLCTKECMGKLSAEHYYNTICANLQTAHFVEIQTLLLLDAFYEFSRCDTCNFLNLVNYKDDTLPDCVSLPNNWKSTQYWWQEHCPQSRTDKAVIDL